MSPRYNSRRGRDNESLIWLALKTLFIVIFKLILALVLWLYQSLKPILKKLKPVILFIGKHFFGNKYLRYLCYPPFTLWWYHHFLILRTAFPYHNFNPWDLLYEWIPMMILIYLWHRANWPWPKWLKYTILVLFIVQTIVCCYYFAEIGGFFLSNRLTADDLFRAIKWW